MLERPLRVGIVELMRRADVDSVDMLVKCLLIRRRELQPEFPGKACRAFRVRIVDANELHTADVACLRHEPPGDAPAADEAHADDFMIVDPPHGTGDALRPLEVAHLAEVFQVIEFSLPIGAQDEKIDAVFLDVLDLLPDMVLDNDLIGEAGLLDVLDARHQGVHDVELAARLIEALRRHADDQVVAQRLGALKQTVVALMKEIERAVGDYFLHFLPPSFAVNFLSAN